MNLRGKSRFFVFLCILSAFIGILFMGMSGRSSQHEENEAGATGRSVMSADVSPGAERRNSSGDVLQPGKPGEGSPGRHSGLPPGKPYVAIVIDDFGFSRTMAEEFAELPIPLTWSIIPFQPYSGFSAGKAAGKKIPFLVHMPMAAQGDRNWKEKDGVIDSGMSAETVTLLLRKAMASLPGAVGMNNHRGSRATADEKIMKMVMNELASTSFIFLDSKTSSSSAAFRTAAEKGIPALSCSVFIDNQADKEVMEEELQRGMAIAAKKGWVVMIAHARQATLEFLRGKKSDSLKKGSFVTIPDLARALRP